MSVYIGQLIVVQPGSSWSGKAKAADKSLCWSGSAQQGGCTVCRSCFTGVCASLCLLLKLCQSFVYACSALSAAVSALPKQTFTGVLYYCLDIRLALPTTSEECVYFSQTHFSCIAVMDMQVSRVRDAGHMVWVHAGCALVFEQWQRPTIFTTPCLPCS